MIDTGLARNLTDEVRVATPCWQNHFRMMNNKKGEKTLLGKIMKRLIVEISYRITIMPQFDEGRCAVLIVPIF